MVGKTDKILRLLWLVNGVAVLLLFIALAVSLIGKSIAALTDNPEGAYITQTQGNDESTPRAVRFTQPISIRGTKTEFVRVYPGRGYYSADESQKGDAWYAAYYNDPAINVAFLDVTGKAHLLFDKPVLILEIDYPNPRETMDVYPLQKWIAYQVITEDTSGNGKFGKGDRIDLFFSDLDGLGLKRVLDDSFTVISMEAFDSGTKVLAACLSNINYTRTLPGTRVREQHEQTISYLSTKPVLPVAAIT